MAWAFQEVHLHALSPSASNVTFFFGGIPQTDTPSPGATNVGAGTLFGWYTMPDSPVYVVSFRPDIGAPAGSPNYDVLIAGSNHLVVPDGISLPRSAPYTWRVRGSSSLSTVENAAGPQGFFAAAPFYRVAQGTPSNFTVVPWRDSHCRRRRSAAPGVGSQLGQASIREMPNDHRSLWADPAHGTPRSTPRGALCRVVI